MGVPTKFVPTQRALQQKQVVSFILHRRRNKTRRCSKYYFRGGHSARFSKNPEETERKVHGLMKRFQSRTYKMRIDPDPQFLLNGGPWDPLNQAMWDVFINKIQKEETYINKLHLWKSIFLFFRVQTRSLSTVSQREKVWSG
jgi:hypothetical protein